MTQPTKFAGKYDKNVVHKPVKKTPMSDVAARLAFHADRLPGNINRPQVTASSPSESAARVELEKAEQAGITLEEYRAREAEAKERTFAIMPMHKSNYVVVADPELVKLMGKKP